MKTKAGSGHGAPPQAGTERYLALRARAVRFVEQAGGEADEASLVRHVLAAGPGESWTRLLATILAGDQRLERGPDGVWRIRRPGDLPGTFLPADYVALELSLMGSRGHRLQVVEVAAALVREDTVAARFVTALRPSRRLTAYARQAARLDVDAFAEAPLFGDVARDLVSFVGSASIVGYDLAPQVAALNGELRRSGRPELANSTIDLLPWMLDRGLIAGKPTLAVALRTLGRGEPPTGRAADRAAAIVEIVAGLRGVAGASVRLPARSEVVRARGPLGPLSPANAAPSASGVYFLRGAGGQVLYVGSARDLRQRLRSYASLATRQLRRMEGLHALVASVTWETAASELSARLLEARHIAELQPPYNVQRRSAPLGAYVAVRPAGAYLRLRIVEQPNTGDECAGPFASAGAARRAWHVAADLFRLHTCTRTMRARRRPPCQRHTTEGLCPAPCVGAITPAHYAARVGDALAFLGGERTAPLAALRAAMATTQRAGASEESARLARLAGDARDTPPVSVGPYQPKLTDGLVPAAGIDPPMAVSGPGARDHALVSAAATRGAAPAAPPGVASGARVAELFCLRDGALFPLQLVARPDDPAAVESALQAGLHAAPLPASAANVARAWLRRRPGAAVVAQTADLRPAGRSAVARALAEAWRESLSERHGEA